MMFNRGFYNGDRCFGYSLFNNGWNMLIVLGVILISGVFIYYLSIKKNKNMAYQGSLEVLKLKFVQGDITEEEYMKRKSVLQEK